MTRPSPRPRRSARWWSSQRPIIRSRPLTLERLEDRSSPTGLALEIGGALTLGSSDGVMANARVALLGDAPSILFPSDASAFQGNVTVTATSQDSSAPVSLFIAPSEDTTADIFASADFASYFSGAISSTVNVPDPAPSTGPANSGPPDGGSGPSATGTGSGSAGSSPAAPAPSGISTALAGAIADWNAGQAAGLAFPDDQARLSVPQDAPPVAPASVPNLQGGRSLADYRASVSTPNFATPGVSLDSHGAPATYVDVAGQAPGLTTAIHDTSVTGATGDNTVDPSRLLQSLPQSFRDLLSSAGTTTPTAPAGNDPTAVFVSAAQMSAAPAAGSSGASSQPPASGTTPPAAASSPPAGQGSAAGSNPSTAPSTTPGSGTAPSAAVVTQLTPSAGTFTLTATITYGYTVYTEDATGNVLADSTGSQTTTLTIDNNTPADQAVLPAFPWTDYAAPVDSLGAGSYSLGTSVVVDLSLKTGMDVSNSDGTGTSITDTGLSPISGSTTNTHTDATIDLHYEYGYYESGSVTRTEPTADATGMRSTRAAYVENSTQRITTQVDTTVTGGSSKADSKK